MDKEELKTIYRTIGQAHKVRAEMYSLWTTELYRLSIANMVILPQFQANIVEPAPGSI